MSEERAEPDGRSLSRELKGTEALLAALRPTVPAIDRDRVMFEAGRTAAKVSVSGRGVVVRRATTFVALAASLLLGIQLGERRAREVDEKVSIATTTPVESAPAEAAPALGPASSSADVKPAKLPADSYGELRRHLAAAESDLPIQAGERRDAAPDAGSWRHRPNEFLRALN